MSYRYAVVTRSNDRRMDLDVRAALQVDSVSVGAVGRGGYVEITRSEVLTVDNANVEKHAVQGGYALHYRIRHRYELN